MIVGTIFNPTSFFYPIGNTPPVCLTQDLPPEQNADILSLGCGDARNILFTCFSDNKRKMDVTCCDIEPLIHARNVLLYTLLIDDESNHNIEQIYNIYYHWKIDEKSLLLLESQTQKLLQISSSIDDWRNSAYGPSIRFCDENSLSSIRCHWLGFTSQGLSSPEKKRRSNQLEAAIKRTKSHRPNKHLNLTDGTGFRSTFPTATHDEAYADLCKVSQQWWDYGTVPGNNSSALRSPHLNPAFFYSPNDKLTMYHNMSSLGGIPLSNAYTPICKESPFCINGKNLSSTERLVNCAKGHFTQWASAFRKSVARGLVIRIFSGDALAFCFTLLGCQATRSTSVNLFSHSWTSSPIILHHGDYGLENSAAPVSFDIIDTSNLIDSLGPLNLLALGSSLLKFNASSSLYTEMLVMLDGNPVDRLSTLFGVDVRCMALLLGLVLPDLFTNATNSVEDHRGTGAEGANDHLIVLVRQVRSRLRWKRSGGYRTSPFSPPIQVEAKELAKLLIRIHDSMFKSEELLLPKDYSNEAEWKIDSCKLMFRPYTRASFAFLLSILKSRVISDWDACLKEMYNGIFSANGRFSTKEQFKQELALNMKIFGVDGSLLSKPNPEDANQTIFASIARQSKDLPDQVCVTMLVPRKDLAVLEKYDSSSLPLVINICGVDVHGEEHRQSFSSVQIMFGKWRQKTEAEVSYPVFEEDSAMLSGSSDMYASVLVPTSYLTLLFKSKKITPLVECGLKYSVTTLREFADKLGPSLHFSYSQLTGGRIVITPFMLGMSGIPNFILTGNQMDTATSDATVAHFSDDSLKINVLVKRITLESEAAKTTLADKSSEVKIKFKSPWIAVVSIAKDFDFQLEFPVPVSALNPKLKIARKSSYVEVEASLLNPLVEDAPVCMFPCLLMKFPCGMVPVPWTSTYIDLDVMPAVDLDGSAGKYGSWVHKHASEMFSVRDHQIRKLNLGWNSRMILKQGLLLLHMVYSGYQGEKRNYFGLRTDKRVHTLFFPTCLRLDLARNTTVLDCALIQLTNDVKLDPLVSKFLKEIKKNGAFLICVTETENIAWKAMMAVMAERCRTWEHRSDCEYTLAGEAPLSKGLRHDRKSSICSCGIGKFPRGYLKDEMKNFSNLDHILNRYGTRVALSLVFSVPHVEDCGTDKPNPDFQALFADKCANCGTDKKKNGPTGEQALFKCSKCKSVKYCSVECQKSDWKTHKKSCKAV